MKYLLTLGLFLFFIRADCQKPQRVFNSCASLIQKGYTQIFCDYDKKNGFKDIPFGITIEALNKLMPLLVFQKNKMYLPYAENDNFKYRNWNNTVFTTVFFEFNKNNQLFKVRLSRDEENDTMEAASQITYEEISKKVEKIFGKAQPYKLTDSTTISTIGKIRGWEGNNIEIIMKKRNKNNITVNIYSKKYDIDKEVDDL